MPAVNTAMIDGWPDRPSVVATQEIDGVPKT
jgi:hypothetical protein